MAKFFDVIVRAAQSESIWHNRPIHLTDGEFWGGFFGAQSSSGKSVTADRALRLSTVWACVRVISTSVSGLPFSLYRRLSDGSREDARDHAVYDLIHTAPNTEMTAMQFWQAVVASMLLWGNAYVRIQRVGNRPVTLEFLLPQRMRLDTDENNRLRYFYTPPKGKEREIDRKDIIHVPGLTLDGRIGLSAIRYGADVFGSAMSTEDAANSTFRHGLMPTVAFKIDHFVKPEQREEFKAYVKTVTGALNAGRPPVLEQGMSAEKIGIDPVDAQLLESRAWSVEEICRWFGCPPWIIGHTDKGSNWGTGLEQQQIAFLIFVISTYTNQIQQSVNAKLLTPAERESLYTEFALEGFLRADSAARSELYAKMTSNGIYTRDEVRVKENLPKKGGNADVLTVQSSMMPLDKLGETTQAQSMQAALKDWLTGQTE